MTPGQPRFFRNYNRIIATAYAVLLVLLAAFFAYQLRQNLRDELAILQGQFERHHQLVELVLRASADQVDALRVAAGRADGDSRRACPSAPALLARSGLREQPAGGFHRDALARRDGGGNLVGEGGLAARDADFYCDLQAALALDGHLQSLAFHLPQAARMRLLSTQAFQLVSPWQPSPTVPFDRRLYDDPVWQLGQPSANPDRLKFWAPTFFGGAELGLLTPVAAPVYDHDRFMGVVALDVSLDHLHRINGGFGYPLGTVAIIDGQGMVLAHPGLYADPLSVQSPAPMSQLFAQQRIPSMQSLLAMPPGRVVSRDGWTFIRSGFSAAPWQLVYSVPDSALWTRLLAERGPTLLAVLVGMAVLMAITYAVTAREFVRPASRLVDHVVAQSQSRPRPVPRVPAAWRPWFDAITLAFRRSVELSSLRKELDIAARMQQSILPRQWPDDPRYTLWGTTAAARDVGGDFYDHFRMAGDRCAMVVADVSGKGIGAGLFAMVSKTLLRSVATQRQGSPAEIAVDANNGLCLDNDTSMFVTSFYAHYEPASGELVYVNAGHPPPLVIRSDGRCEWLAPTGGTAFGAMEDLPYVERSEHLAPGDTLLMYSDGVTEAESPAREPFGLVRLFALFAGKPTAGARESIDRVLAAVNEFTAGADQFDDITCMALHCGRLGARS